jgi:hypothetical protein
MVALGHQAQAAEQREQAAAGFFLEAAGATEIGLLQATLGEQRLDDARLAVGLRARGGSADVTG